MNLFRNLFTSALFYLLILYSPVLSRISDKRKCADPACSEPVSFATTLIRYNADDDRLLSFPRNIKVRVFSKEAGDSPNFWEVEEEGSSKCLNFQGSREHFLALCEDVFRGKRGYVPKGLLREDRVLVPTSKLTHIVPTGRSDSPKLNDTSKDSEELDSNPVNLLAATPNLSEANSKGLFSTIGGVSADSVPMNSPDIKPQSTRKFQVLDGTTVYDDVVNEKPESPPTVINDHVNENQSSDKKSNSKEVLPESDVPSSDIKPVHESIDENKITETVAEIKNIEKRIEQESDMKVKSEDEGNVAGTPGESYFDNFVNTMSNLISSGAGEDVTEDELEEEDGEEEGSVEDDDYEDEEGESKVQDIIIESKAHQSGDGIHTEGVPLKATQTNTTETASLIDNNSLDNKSPDESVKHHVGNKEVEVSTGKSEDLSSDEKTLGSSTENIINKSAESSVNITVGKKDEIKIDEQYNPPNTSEEIHLPDHLEVNTTTSSLDHVHELSPEQNEYMKELSAEANTEGESVENKSFEIDENLELNMQEKDKTEPHQEETKSKTGESLDQENINGDEPQVESTSDSPQLKEQIKTDESQIDKQSKTSEPQDEKVKSDEPQAQEQSKIVDPQIQEQTNADKPLTQEKSETKLSENFEIQVEEHSKTDEYLFQGAKTDQQQSKVSQLKLEEHTETATQFPPLQPTAQNFLFGSGPTKEESVEKKDDKFETPPSSEQHVEIKSASELVNDTAQDKLTPPHPIHSIPTLQPLESPKYTSVVSRRIQNSGPISSVREIPSHPEEKEEEEEMSEQQLTDTFDTSESMQTNEETPSPNLSLQSQSPKYGSVVSTRIGISQPPFDGVGEVIPEKTEAQELHPDSAGIITGEEIKEPEVDKLNEQMVKPLEETETYKEITVENDGVPLQDSQIPHSDNIPAVKTIEEVPLETASGEGMFSWAYSLFDLFGSKDTEESPAISESPVTVSSHFEAGSCAADGLDGSCPPPPPVETMQKEVTWQETTDTFDIVMLLDKVPLEATIWLIVTAVVVLIFSLGHYYIEAHRRDGPLVAMINKLEREVLILKKERCIMEDRLNIAEQQLETWNTSSTENDALLVELKQELDETKAAKAELEEQVLQLKEELDTVTESGLEMHRLLEESLSSQDGSQVLLSTVETLREKLQRQEEEISGLSDTLSSKDAEIEEMQSKLAHSAEVARSLEDKVISVTREKEEELLQLRDKHRELISQLEEVMETKALDETRLSTEMSKLRLTIEELQKTLAERDAELDTLKEVVKQLRSTDSNEKMEALFDVVSVQAKLKTAVTERDDFREKFLEEEGARKLLEGHMKKITQEVAELKNSFETAEKEKIEALTKLQVLSNYFKEKESQLQKELGLQESMWLQKQSDDHTIYEQMRSLREENEKYKLQNESLKKEIVEQEASFKIQLANTEQKAHENWVASRQAERRLKEAQQEAAQLRNRLTTVEKNSANYSLDEKPNISESNGDPSSPPPSLMFPPTTSPPFMMYGPPMPPPGDFVPPPPLMGSPYPSDSRPPPLGRISSPPLDPRFSPPPPLPYPPYDYTPYGHHSPSPPPPMPPHHRNVHKPQPREMSREQKDHVPNYPSETEKTSRRNKR